MRINGLKVVDAPRNLQIDITPSDIKKGKSKNPGDCAAAQSIRRGVDGCTDARVHLGRTYIKMADKWLRFHTPQSLRAEIIAFDRGAEFAVGTYTLSRLQASKTKGKRQGSNVTKSGPKRKRAPYHTVTGVRQHGANR